MQVTQVSVTSHPWSQAREAAARPCCLGRARLQGQAPCRLETTPSEAWGPSREAQAGTELPGPDTLTSLGDLQGAARKRSRGAGAEPTPCHLHRRRTSGGCQTWFWTSRAGQGLLVTQPPGCSATEAETETGDSCGPEAAVVEPSSSRCICTLALGAGLGVGHTGWWQQQAPGVGAVWSLHVLTEGQWGPPIPLGGQLHGMPLGLGLQGLTHAWGDAFPHQLNLERPPRASRWTAHCYCSCCELAPGHLAQPELGGRGSPGSAERSSGPGAPLLRVHGKWQALLCSWEACVHGPATVSTHRTTGLPPKP